MTCGLSEPEIEILKILYGGRCISSNHSFNLKKVCGKFRTRYDADPNDIAKELENKKYLGSVPKASIKYYISDMAKTTYAINQHGGNATEGRIIPRRVFRL